MAREVWVIHGPNLHLLGRRERTLYGSETLAAIDKRLATLGADLGLRVESFQTNHEGALIDRITIAMDAADGCLINPGGLSHTSIALADAIRASTIPTIEVHVTNLYAREPERRVSLTAAAARGVVMGFGSRSYDAALWALASMLRAGARRRAR
jgi:3-dehydroquinate dehydratase II